MQKLDGHIIITADEFLEAVKAANEKFMKISRETPGSKLVEAMMGIQNLAFGALVGEVLFGEEDE